MLGASIEFMTLQEIRQEYGSDGLKDYEGRVGKITDDTQMALFTLEGMMRARLSQLSNGTALNPSILHNAYLRWLSTQFGSSANYNSKISQSGWLTKQRLLHTQRAPGYRCISSLQVASERGMDLPINNSKGCGGVMRIAPVGLMLDDPFQLACEIAAITHGHATGFLSAGFMAEVVSQLCKGSNINEAMRMAIKKLKEYPDYEETFYVVNRALSLAANSEASPEIVEQLGGGWIAEEALAIALFCALEAENFRQGILLAVNHGGDSDSTGAIAGNLLGLIHGIEDIPTPWIEYLDARQIIDEMVEDAIEILTLQPNESAKLTDSDNSTDVLEKRLLEKYPPN